jgi:GNAT superfamily N-acetyltransferase
MYPRIGSAYGKRPPDRNREALHDVVADGPPPGLVAIDGTTAVGWCQVTPRDDVPALDGPWRLRRVDDTPVWCISCFYIRKTWRRRGVMSALINAAVDFAGDGGAAAVEVYPIDASLSPSATSMGYADTFERLGFTEVARRSPERPIMRYQLR